MENKPPVITRDHSPYAIAKFLQQFHGIQISPQLVYKDREKGLLIATRNAKGKWVVSPDNANAYIAMVLGEGAHTSRKGFTW